MTTQPNILVIMTDDHGQWASGCYGTREIHTPSMDYLASTGVRMANSFTATPVCSPARASFFTGLYPSQHGVHDWLFYHVNVKNDEQREALKNQPSIAGETTLAQMLAGAGYTCGLSGKWHCGGDDDPQPGFDTWYSLRTNPPARDGQYSNNGEFVEHQGYHTDIITENAVSFLKGRDEGKPFFLFVGYIGTHSPWRDHPERLVEQYRECAFDDLPDDITYPFGRLAGESTQNSRFNRREALAQYYASVTHIDEGIGRLLNELDAQGLREDTLVVYTADHGLNCSQHGLWGKGNGTRPLNMLEESIRIPMIFNQPGQVFAGQVRPEFVDHCDLFETLLDTAGVAPERQKNYPGRSFKPVLTQARALPGWRDKQVCEYGHVRMVRTERYKLIRRYSDEPDHLFDLVNDPREVHDIFDAQPAIVSELTARLDNFFDRYEDPAKSGLRVRDLPRHNFNEAWRDEPV
jgi:arylsulfatase A-like enzyme